MLQLAISLKKSQINSLDFSAVRGVGLDDLLANLMGTNNFNDQY